MKKFLLPLLTLAFLAACEPSMEDKIDQAKDMAEDTNNEFIEANANSTPEEAVNAKYDELAAQYGGPDTYFTLYNGNNPSWEESFYISEQLNLDYEKLAYIQQQSGTYGLRSVIQSIKSDEKVDYVLETFNNFLDASDGDISYFKDKMPKGLSAQEEAEFIAQEIINAYSPFYKLEDVKPWNQNFVNKYAEISGLKKENLEAIDTWWSLDFYTKLLPGELGYKSELETLITQRYEL